MKNFDNALLFSMFAVLIIGMAALYSASITYYSSSVLMRQLIWIGFGLMFFFAAFKGMAPQQL